MVARGFRKTLPPGWTHYMILLGIANVRPRRFYFDQACVQRWSKRELRRQINGALFERVTLSRDTQALAALEKSKRAAGGQPLQPILQRPISSGFSWANRGLFGEGFGAGHHQQIATISHRIRERFLLRPSAVSDAD